MRNKVWLGATLALAVIAILTHVISPDRGATPTGRVGSVLLDGEALTKVTRLELTAKDKGVVLNRDADGRWTLASDGFPVAAERIVRYLENLNTRKIVRRVGTSRDDWASLELTEGTVVKASAGDQPLLEVHLGKSREGGGQYVRFSGDESYLVDQLIGADLDPASWELKQLVEVKRDQIKQVHFLPQKAPDALLKREAKDKPLTLEGLAEGEAPNQTALTQAASLLESLRFSSRAPLDEAKAKDRFAAASVAEATTFDGATYRVRIATVEQPAKKDDPAGKPSATYFMALEIEPASSPMAAADQKLVLPLMKSWLFEVDSGIAERFLKSRKDFITAPQSASKG